MLFVKAWFFCLEPRVFREGKKQWILEEKRKFVLWTPRYVRIIATYRSICGYFPTYCVIISSSM